MYYIWKHFALCFTALFPLINPVGTALIFVGLVGNAPIETYRSLSRRIAINTIIFLAVIELIGSYLLGFFGISLPIMQLSGGIVIALIGFTTLNDKEVHPNPEKANAAQPAITQDEIESLTQRAFYPYTFPITAGPGSLVVMLTLSVHADEPTVTGTVLAHIGLFIAVVVISAMVYLCYAYAPRLARTVSPATAHGIIRVVAFILLCIGVQIAWNGLSTLLHSVLHPA